MSVVTRQVCETCGESFVPERNRVGRFCSRVCRNEANRYTVLPAKDTRRGEAGRGGGDSQERDGGAGQADDGGRVHCGAGPRGTAAEGCRSAAYQVGHGWIG
jgi:hypothetical protein